MLESEPPHSRVELERCATIANVGAEDASSLRSRGAVKQRSQVGEDLAISVRVSTTVLLELGAQRRRATPHTIACLTSARGDRYSAHVHIVVASIFARTSVALRQPPRVASELVARALERRVQ